jgi:cyclic pyranopterin phosphate synthase
MPRDSFGREIDYLRISVIDHCNLRCVYCMPLSGLRFTRFDDLMSPAEIERVAPSASAACRVCRISP